MPPKKRLRDNAGLPARWRKKGRSYYYRVPAGQESAWDDKTEFPLGSDLPKAYALWAERLNRPDQYLTMAAVFDRYAAEIVPTKKPATQTQNAAAIKTLRAVFGNLHPAKITPTMARKYMSDRKAGKYVVRGEVEVLRHALTWARDWGIIDSNQLLGQIKLGKKPARTRVVTDDELLKIRALPGAKQMRAYMEVKILTGLRRYDMLRLGTPDRYADGIEVTTSKTGKRLIIEMTPALHQAMLTAQQCRPVQISPWLFCNSLGGCYMQDDGTAPAFKLRWQRWMTRLVKSGIDRFVESDLRSRAADDAGSLTDAQALLGHASSDTTERNYRRRIQTVKPTR